MFYHENCILYTVYKIQCTVYRRLYTMYCVHSLIYSELFALFIRILVLTVVLIQLIVHTYLCLELYCKQCMFCILFTLFNWFLGVMHTVRFVTVYWIQFTAYIMYNTVYSILQYSYCIHPCQTRRHYSAASIVLPTDGTAL